MHIIFSKNQNLHKHCPIENWKFANW
jgi:hypothetical protein